MNDKLLFSDQSEREYILSDYFATHGQLLIRGRKNAKYHCNVDLVFKAVTAMYIPVRFVGLSIWEITDQEKIDQVTKNFKFNTDFGNMVFKITNSGKNEFYVNALAFGIMENELELMETCLDKGGFDFSGNKVILWHTKKSQ